MLGTRSLPGGVQRHVFGCEKLQKGLEHVDRVVKVWGLGHFGWVWILETGFIGNLTSAPDYSFFFLFSFLIIKP